MKNKNSSLIKSGLKMLMILISVISGILFFLFIFLLFKSPGEPEPYLDAAGKPIKGSLSEKSFVDIGGVRQGMFIRSKNINNPVLLYVHGGPAFPNYFLIEKYKPELEDYFTVCYWEQRGGGLSFSADVSVESMNFGQLTDDAVEVANYLRKRFAKEKIFIFAHSGGTPIALMAVHKAPEIFSAYFGMAQIANQAESERMAFNYIRDEYIKRGNRKALSELNQFNGLKSDSDVEAFFKSAVRDRSMHELGIGTMHRMNSVFRDIFIPVWTCKAYTLTEKINIWKSKLFFLPKTKLIHELLTRDFTKEITKVEIPVYFFSGKYDLTVNAGLSEAYLRRLNAPQKGFYLFNNSAHSPLFEEPEAFRSILKNVLLNNTSH